MGYTLRLVETRPEGQRVRVGLLAGGGQQAPPHQLGGLEERCNLPQRGPWRSPGKFGFWSILLPQKSRQNGQLAYLEATSESGGQVPPAPTYSRHAQWGFEDLRVQTLIIKRNKNFTQKKLKPSILD